MAADLTFKSLTHRKSIVLQEDHLVELEHAATKDRVRRIQYDRVESVVSWRQPPWGRMVLFGAVLGLPGVALLFVGDAVTTWIALVMGVILLLVELSYLYMGKTRIRITRAGRDFEFVGITSPRKVERLLMRLQNDIRRTQDLAAARTRPGHTVPTAGEQPNPGAGPHTSGDAAAS